jgi:hypothetical protein
MKDSVSDMANGRHNQTHRDRGFADLIQFFSSRILSHLNDVEFDYA